MKLLLDTHALLWWLTDDARLQQRVRELISDAGNDVLVSMVSFWEIVKTRGGKLEADLREISDAVRLQGFTVLNLSPAHLVTLGGLRLHADHRDPFDRLLIAQAITEAATFVSDDRHTRRYPVQVLTCSDP